MNKASFSKIIATGCYLPSNVVTNNDIAAYMDTSDEWIYSRTGIKERRFAQKGELTSDLATNAANDALKKANLKASDIDLIIVATTTPDLTFPSTATIVQRKLQASNAFAFDIQAVCSGFIYGLDVADSYIRTGKAKRVLLIGAETFSNLLNMEDRTTYVLFGDGAGAVILEATEENPNDGGSGIIDIILKSNGDYGNILKTSDRNGEKKDLGVIEMQGQDVYKFAVTNLANIVIEILNKNNIDYSSVDWLIPHQANKRIIASVAQKLKMDMDKVILTIQKHANTSAASIPLALNEAIEDGRVKKGDFLLLEALGGGITWGASIVRL